jgi:hypothetical protein
MVVANDVRCARKSPPEEKDVNEPLGGIQQRDRYQQRDRAQGVNRRRFDHTGCARFQIDGAGAGGEAGGKGIPGA